MKRILLASLVAASLMISCQESPYEPIDSLSDLTWVTSVYPGNENCKAVGDHISFIDASVGCLSHEWILDEGCRFMINDFDDKSDDLSQYIDPDKGKSSSDDTVHIYFESAGKKTITLKNTFAEEVSFNGTPDGLKIYEDVESGCWVAEKIFLIDVYGTIVPKFEVYREVEDGAGALEWEMVVMNDDPLIKSEITINVGDRVKFVDVTTEGSVNEWSWFVPNAAGGDTDSFTHNSQAAEVTFTNVGTFSNARLTATRNLGSDSYLPNAYAIVNIPLTVNVEKSTAPLTIKETVAPALNSADKSIIQVSLSSGVSSLSADAGDEFVVTVNNVESNVVDHVVAVESVAINDENNTILDLKLSERLYDNDTSTISYTGATGKIISESDTDLAAFETRDVAMPAPTSLISEENYPQAGFELPSEKPTEVAGLGWFVQQGADAILRSDEQKFEGDYSLKIEMNNALATQMNLINAQLMSTTDKVTLKAGEKMKIKFAIYVDSETVMAGDSFGLTVSAQGHPMHTFTISTIDNLDKWVELETPAMELTLDIADKAPVMFACPQAQVEADAANNVKFFIDEARSLLVDDRPLSDM